jgi:hypothetical protein
VEKIFLFIAFFISTTCAAQLSLGVIQTNFIMCEGDGDAVATVSVTGGNPPYLYNWTSGQSTAIATGLSPGTHQVTVTDSLASSAVISISILEPQGLTALITTNTAVCSGYHEFEGIGMGGTLLVGSTSLSYEWSTGDTTAIMTISSGGTFCFSATDDNNCLDTTCVTVSQPIDSLSVTITNNFDSTATTAVSGGTVPYTYLWDTQTNNQTTATAIGLSGNNTYQVTVTDSVGCTKIVSKDLSVGISRIYALESLNVFPNPNNGIFYVKGIFKKTIEGKLKIENMLGQVIKIQDFNGDRIEELIEMEQQDSGIYFLSLMFENKMFTQKIKILR